MRPQRIALALLLPFCVLAVSPVLAQRVAGPAPGPASGWAAIREGRHQAALDAFTSATAVSPRDPALHLGAGLASYLLGQVDEARQSLRRALSLAPQFTAAALLLADILHRQNELGEAIAVLETALTHVPGDRMLTSRLERVRREATLHSGFFQAQGAHFTVLFEGPADEELARRALEILEAAYWRIGTTLLVFPARIIPVVLYTEQQFRDITRSPAWAAAAFDGRIKVPVRGALDHPGELERVLTHEFAHALVQSVAPSNVPAWLHEGLAVAFEPDGAAWADDQLASSKERIPLPRLANGFARLSDTQARVAYAQSAAAVRALLDDAGPMAMTALLQDVAAGEPFEAAFERRMLIPYAAFATAPNAAR